MSDYPKTITLPISGKTAVINRRPKGRDIQMAHRLTGANKRRDVDQVSITYAIIAQLVTIDGKDVVWEDLSELDLEDLTALMTAAGFGSPAEEDDFLSRTKSPSAGSSSSGSGPAN